MSIRMGFRLASGLVITLASLQVSAQSATSGTVPNDASVAASAVPAQSTRAANRALRRQVYAAIVRHQEIDAGNISVIASNGAVTLKGTVTDTAQIDLVTNIAKGVPGVMSVTPRLTVKKSFSGE